MFCSQALPDPMRCVPLLPRRFQIQQQYLLDLIFDWTESRLVCDSSSAATEIQARAVFGIS
jgi:hypothetical protein